MVILLDWLITVADGAVSNCIDMVRVVESVVTVVVANWGDDYGKNVKVGKRGEFSDFTLDQYDASHLKDISSVDIIVILDFCDVSCLDFVKEFW